MPRFFDVSDGFSYTFGALAPEEASGLPANAFDDAIVASPAEAERLGLFAADAISFEPIAFEPERGGLFRPISLAEAPLAPIELAAFSPSDAGLPKTAAGDTSLAQNLNPYDDWSPLSRGEMFDRAQARIEAASRALGKRPDAVFVSQGEADATDRAASAAYHANFRAYVDAVRARWMRNAQGYVAWTQVAAGGPYAPRVARAQAADALRDAR